MSKSFRLPPLDPAFYLESADVVAPRLLGKILVVRGHDGVFTAGEIIEVEAYLGETDPASHAFGGMKMRNRSMFAAGGSCYVYLSYGMHFCMNVVTGREGYGEAVLIRAISPFMGLEQMCLRRGIVRRVESSSIKGVADGPGKLTQAMGIDLRFDGLNFFTKNYKIIDCGRKLATQEIAVSARIGISKAADLPLRFYIKAARGLSRPHKP